MCAPDRRASSARRRAIDGPLIDASDSSIAVSHTVSEIVNTWPGPRRAEGDPFYRHLHGVPYRGGIASFSHPLCLTKDQLTLASISIGELDVC